MHRLSTHSWRAVRSRGPHYARRSHAHCAAKHPKIGDACVPHSTTRYRDGAAGSRWRLYRLLCIDEHATSVESCPARQPATTKLRVGTRRVSRRASSLLASGHPFRRPGGQTFAPRAAAPVVQPSKRLDYELEMAIWIGTGNPQGTAIPVTDAAGHVFGLGLLNDWSARDIQAWEYQPLGPFLGKNFFATTVSPWIVTLEALEPFRVPWERREEYPQPLPYLDAQPVRAAGAFDVHLEALIETAAMRDAGRAPRAAVAFELPQRVLDARSDGRAPHRERMQFGARRPVWHGNDIGCRSGRGRVAARAHLRRISADHLAERREPHVSSKWRPHRSSRLVRTRRSPPHRLG